MRFLLRRARPASGGISAVSGTPMTRGRRSHDRLRRRHETRRRRHQRPARRLRVAQRRHPACYRRRIRVLPDRLRRPGPVGALRRRPHPHICGGRRADHGQRDRPPDQHIAAVVGGPGFRRPPPAHCVEDSCQGPLQPPPDLETQGSEKFRGHDNPTPTRGGGNRHHGRHKKSKRHKRHAKHRGRRGHGRHSTHRHGEAEMSKETMTMQKITPPRPAASRGEP